MARASVVALALGVAGGAAAYDGSLHHGDDNIQSFKAGLSGFQEVPSILTAGTADLRLTLDSAGTTLSFALSYQALAGGAVQTADIQFAQPGVKGGLVAYLCGGGSKPACPAPPATINGSIVASDILGPAAQGLAAGVCRRRTAASSLVSIRQMAANDAGRAGGLALRPCGVDAPSRGSG